MKNPKPLAAAFLFLCVLFLSSCLKPNHQIRVANKYALDANVIIGPNSYGVIKAGTVSSYRQIPEGSYNISGDVSGSVSVSGKGTHYWTISIESTGKCTMKEDK